MIDMDLNDDTEKKVVEGVFWNAVDILSEEDRRLPHIHAILPMLKRGVGVHHSGLLPILKEVIEILFQEGLIKVISFAFVVRLLLFQIDLCNPVQDMHRGHMAHSILLLKRNHTYIWLVNFNSIGRRGSVNSEQLTWYSHDTKLIPMMKLITTMCATKAAQHSVHLTILRVQGV